MSLRTGLKKSKNMVSIRILQAIGASYAQDWITHFGFEPKNTRPISPWHWAPDRSLRCRWPPPIQCLPTAVTASNPYLVTKITDQRGKVLLESKPPVLDESTRGIDARNAFIMDSLLQEVARSGTAAKAQATLKRPDLFGKTGTTNDSIDTWFVVSSRHWRPRCGWVTTHRKNSATVRPAAA
jgi:penicillin-binding protein 1A